MSFDLPPHLQTLNSIPTSSPPSGIDAEQEDAFWGYMHTDDLFRNFGFVPSPNELSKKQLDEEDGQKPSVDVTQPETHVQQPQLDLSTIQSESSSTPSSQSQNGAATATLESFLAAFANEPNPYLMNLPYTTPSTSAPTPVTGVNTHDIMGGPSNSEEDDKPSGAKKLKQAGAGQNEIEEE
jgi:hypothetical protein